MINRFPVLFRSSRFLFRYSNRSFHKTQPFLHRASENTDKPVIHFSFIDKDGKEYPVEGHVGDHLLGVAHAHKVDLEGACEASLACSTCHIILPKDIYNQLPEPSEEENDMLDLAFGLTQTY